MAEVEIHTGHEHMADPFGQRVGIMVGIIGILLSIVTILAHREHSAAVVHKTEANDQWAFYQAKKIREHNAQIGATLLNALAADPAKVAAASARLSQDSERYTRRPRTSRPPRSSATRSRSTPSAARCASISARVSWNWGW